MPRRLPLYVERNHVSGRTYLSFRRGKGPRIRLPDDPTTEEFRAAYSAALAGTTYAIQRKHDAGSIEHLIASYKLSNAYYALQASTKISYSRAIEALRTQHGNRSVAGLSRERIESGILRPYADRPGAALAILKMLRVLIRHAMRLPDGHPVKLRDDPSIGIAPPTIKEIRSWTNLELAAFERRWPIGSKQRTAYALMLYVGSARVDTHRMTWSQLDVGAVYTRSKTGVAVDIDIDEELARALAAWPRTHVTIINTEYGRPFTVNGFSRFMRDAITQAGLPLDCKPHGLRKTLGRMLADAGVSAHDIMAVLGHTTLAEAERYTREADRKRGGKRAIATLGAARRENRVTQTNVIDLGKGGKTKGGSA